MTKRIDAALTVSPAGETALNVRRATVIYRTVIYRNGHLALKQATFANPRWVIAGLMGANGSGKSPLFKSWDLSPWPAAKLPSWASPR